MLASSQGSVKMVNYLVSLGADLDLQDEVSVDDASNAVLLLLIIVLIHRMA